MTMSVDFSSMSESLDTFSTHMEEMGKEKGLVIRVMHQDIFDSMHKI